MKRFPSKLVILTAIGWLACFTVGCQITAARATPTPVPIATPMLPPADVPGADFADLPRFPGARRAEYEQTLRDDLLVTTVEYVVPAALAPVHDFYRARFPAHGWFVADAAFDRDQWAFLLLSGAREAFLTLAPHDVQVVIAIEVSEPVNTVRSGTPLPQPMTAPRLAPPVTPTPAQAPTQAPLDPPPTQLPPLDDDDDGSGIEDGGGDDNNDNGDNDDGGGDDDGGDDDGGDDDD